MFDELSIYSLVHQQDKKIARLEEELATVRMDTIIEVMHVTIKQYDWWTMEQVDMYKRMIIEEMKND